MAWACHGHAVATCARAHLGLCVQAHDAVARHAEQRLNHLVLLGHLFLDGEEGYTVSLERATQLHVAELGVQLRHALQLAVLGKYLGFEVAAMFDVLWRHKVGQTSRLISRMAGRTEVRISESWRDYNRRRHMRGAECTE